jgi:hypothetical protein
MAQPKMGLISSGLRPGSPRGLRLRRRPDGRFDGAERDLLSALYAALDYAVRSRTREIGVRLAIGPQPGRIVALLLRETVRAVALGFALGLGVYAVAGVWLDRVLYGIRRWDPFAIGLVLALMVLVAICATGPATYRATRIDAHRRCAPSRLFQRESVDAPADDHDVLFAVLADVGHGIGVAFGVELGFPEELMYFVRLLRFFRIRWCAVRLPVD